MVKKLKICFITEDFYPQFIGGQGIYGWKLVSELVQEGNSITVLAENRLGRKEFWGKKKNIQLFLVPFCFGNQLILALLEYLYFIFRFSDTYFDIVHANQLSGLFFALFKPSNVGKVIVSIHNTNRDLYTETKDTLKRFLYRPLILLEKIMYRRADAVLFHSESERQAVSNYYNLQQEKLGTVYMGVSSIHVTKGERLKAQREVKKQLKLGSNEKIILCVARLVKRKNVDVILATLQILQNEGIHVQGVIIGDGPEKQYLQSISPRNVSFLGFLDNQAVREFYLAADLFVLTSVGEGGVSLAAMEAASYGLPLILSHSSAGFPIIKEGLNGFVIEPNPQKLAEKIQIALKKSEEMGKKSRSIIKQFTWKKCARETIAFYQSILEKQ